MRRAGAAILAFAAPALVLAGCYGEADAELPSPYEITREASGYYCRMIVADHPGPKAQIHLKGQDAPLWFPSVRDAFTFAMLPGEAKNIRAIYVNDMGRAKNWRSPEAGTWINVRDAYYVLGSSRMDGMGQREVIPFGTAEAAAAFAAEFGGRVAGYADVPADYVLGDDGSSATSRGSGEGPGAGRQDGAI